MLAQIEFAFKRQIAEFLVGLQWFGRLRSQVGLLWAVRMVVLHDVPVDRIYMVTVDVDIWGAWVTFRNPVCGVGRVLDFDGQLANQIWFDCLSSGSFHAFGRLLLRYSDDQQAEEQAESDGQWCVSVPSEDEPGEFDTVLFGSEAAAREWAEANGGEVVE